MKFKSFCYEVWLNHIDECISYNQMAQPYTDWARQNRWYLKKMYRSHYGNLQKDWMGLTFTDKGDSIET
jgi:hypothetical protein